MRRLIGAVLAGMLVSLTLAGCGGTTPSVSSPENTPTPNLQQTIESRQATTAAQVNANPPSSPSEKFSWISVSFPYGCIGLPSTWSVTSEGYLDVFTAPNDTQGYHSVITVKEISYNSKPWVSSSTFYNYETEDLAQNAVQANGNPKVEANSPVHTFGYSGV